MFVVTVTFEAHPDRAADFLTRVRQQAADSLTREDGCHRFDVCTDPAQPGRVFLYELYTDEAAFRAHLETAHFRAFDAAAGPMLRARAVETWTLAG
jgi:quinol monooxygenase YgiN